MGFLRRRCLADAYVSTLCRKKLLVTAFLPLHNQILKSARIWLEKGLASFRWKFRPSVIIIYNNWWPERIHTYSLIINTVGIIVIIISTTTARINPQNGEPKKYHFLLFYYGNPEWSRESALDTIRHKCALMWLLLILTLALSFHQLCDDVFLFLFQFSYYLMIIFP